MPVWEFQKKQALVGPSHRKVAHLIESAVSERMVLKPTYLRFAVPLQGGEWSYCASTWTLQSTQRVQRNY